MKKFSDFAQDISLDGEKVSIDSILDKELIILGCRTRNSRFSKCNNGNYIIIQIQINGSKFVVFTASTVLYDQLEKYKNEIPFSTTIAKIGKHYTLK